MLNRFSQLISVLMILFILLFLAGVSSASGCDSTAGTCQASHSQQAPQSDDDGDDHHCECHICGAIILSCQQFQITFTPITATLQLISFLFLPADYIHSIDYPPEAV